MDKARFAQTRGNAQLKAEEFTTGYRKINGQWTKVVGFGPVVDGQNPFQ